VLSGRGWSVLDPQGVDGDARVTRAASHTLEGAVGAWAKNEYFEMHVDGLTPQLVG
jgi:hypothetical protein